MYHLCLLWRCTLNSLRWNMKIQEIEKLILNTDKQVRSEKSQILRLFCVATIVVPMMYMNKDLILFTVTSLMWMLCIFISDHSIEKKKTKKLREVISELTKKIENYELVLNSELLESKPIDIVKIYDLLKIKEMINKNKVYLWWFNYNDILMKINNIILKYQNYVLQNKPKEFEVQVVCNFDDVSVFYSNEKNIVDLLTHENFDIFDIINNRISYQNDLLKNNLHKSLNLNNIKYVESVFNEFPDKQKIIIDFLISVKGGVFDKNQSAIIKKILGSPMYDIFEKNNTIDRCTNDSVNLLQLRDTVAFIVNNLEKLPQKAKIDFDFIKKDYEKAQSLDLLKTQECKSIFENKFKKFMDIINSNETEKQEQLRFMKYLSKAL